MKTRNCWQVGALIIAAMGRSGAGPLLDMEAFADSTPLNNQYVGVSFSNAIIATAGLSLNELEFPPFSGTNVALDFGGPISILFSTPALTFSAYFTYGTSIVLNAFDSADQLVGTRTSAFSSNVVSSGHTPNELLQLSFSGGIARVVVSGRGTGGSFAVDDISFTTASGTPIPEPGSVFHFALAFAVFCACSRPRPPNG